MKQASKRLLAILLCLAVLPVDGFAVWAKGKVVEPPAYMRELSRLVAATASESDFGRITLTVGEPEMEVDGETQPITDDGYAAPFVDENDELQIPVEVIGEADLNGSGFLSEEELEEQGYDVQMNDTTGEISITEPYGLCRLIVKTADGKVRNTYGATRKIAVSGNKTVLQYADKEAAAAAAAKLRADPSVLACVPDKLVSIDAQTSPDNVYVNYPGSRCWGTQRSGADAWMNTHADDRLAEVIVAVIDTGVDAAHPFLDERVLSSGWDFVNDDGDPMDDHSHGTHCAGIIRDATTGNVKILPVKVLGANGSGSNAVAHEAIRWAVDQGADILSMSFGAAPDAEDYDEDGSLDSFLEIENAPIQYAYNAGVTCVAAAGNDAQSLDEHPITPAVLPHVITVGSIGEDDLPSYFSNRGSAVEICAPGENVVSSVPNGRYQSMSGTSMATPLAAAVCANFLSVDKTQTPDDILEEVLSRAEDVGEPGWDLCCGAGCVSMRDFTPVAGISLPYETMRLPVGTCLKLRPVFSPSNASNRTASFSSSAPDVATVDGLGNVYTKSGGSALITAVSTDGGFTAQCVISVFGGSGVHDVFAAKDDMFVLRTDGTVHYEGLALPKFGNASGYFGSWGIVRDQKRMPIAGITKFWELPIYVYRGVMIQDLSLFAESYYMKEDGKLRKIDKDGISVVQKKANKQPLTGVTEMQRTEKAVFALVETGTVYTCCDGAWTPVRKEDGSVLENVRHIGGHAAFCTDGTVWFLTQMDDQTYDAFMLAVPYTSIPDAVDGFILADSSSGAFLPQTVVLLRADGTVWGAGDNYFNFLGLPDLESTDTPVQITFEDGQPLTGVCALHFNGFGVFALREDGTVTAWGAASKKCRSDSYLGVGQAMTEPQYPKPVVTEDGTPLTGVKALLRAYSGRMLYLREDDSVWLSGMEKYQLNGLVGSKIEHPYAVPFTIADDPVYLVDLPMEPFEKIAPAQSVVFSAEQIFLGIGDTIRLSAHVLPVNADNTQVVFESASCTVACVSEKGEVTGAGEGTTTIRACAAEAPDDVYAVCTVTVGSAKMESVFVSELPDKILYNPGELLDTDGGELCLRLENGTVERIPLQTKYCGGFNPQRAGWQRVTVGYAGLSASFSVFVRQKEVTSVTLKKPDKTDYLLDEELDLTGAMLTIRYDDDTKSIVPLTEGMCEPFDFDNEKDNVLEISVRYLGFNMSFLVHVHAPQICGIEMYTLPDKQDYTNETQIDPAGGEIVYIYDDGSQGEVLPITTRMCDSSALRRLGVQDVTVSIDGFTTTYPIYVHAVEGATLSMRTLPTVKYYQFTGSTVVDPRGGVAVLKYADGAQKTVEITKSMCSFPEGRKITADSWEITVTYLGLTTSFTIRNYKSVPNFTLDHIEMARLPDNTDIRQYQRYEPTGGVVRLYGTNGRQLNVALSPAMVTTSNTFTVGEKTVAVKVENCQTSFCIRVLPNREYTLVKPPDQTVYCLGEVFNTEGLEYTVTQYSTDPDEPESVYSGPVIPSWYCTGFNTKQVGRQTVSVKPEYQWPLQFTIYVTDMTLESDAALLQRGQSTWMRPAFRYTPQETPELTWTSSDTSVAKVNRSGRVTAVGVGTAEITAKVNDFCTAVRTITVQEEDVEPNALVFVQAPGELLPGDSVQILANPLPLNAAARPITWTSSDPSILSVDQTGTVTAIRKGTVQLTAQIQGTDAAAARTIRVTEQFSGCTPGDADCDGDVTLKDIVQMIRYLAGGWDAVIDLKNADVTGDDAVDLKDVVILRRYLAGGWDVELK